MMQACMIWCFGFSAISARACTLLLRERKTLDLFQPSRADQMPDPLLTARSCILLLIHQIYPPAGEILHDRGDAMNHALR